MIQVFASFLPKPPKEGHNSSESAQCFPQSVITRRNDEAIYSIAPFAQNGRLASLNSTLFRLPRLARNDAVIKCCVAMALFRWFGVVVGMFLICFSTFAQTLTTQEAIEDIVEEISSLENADANLEVMYETLAGYSINPLNLNTASETELLQLHVLNEFQAASIHEYIALYGEMQTPYELQYVHGITQGQMKLLLPFVTAIPTDRWQRPTIWQMLTRGQHQLLGRVKQTVEKQQGYKPIADSVLVVKPNSRYLGSQQNIYLRYRYAFGSTLQWGLTAEKDAGEPFGRKVNPVGFDFYSGHIQLNKIGPLRTLVLGDYYIQLGQGLSLWQGGSFGKSSDGLSVAKRGAGVKAYSGADENMFFRGIATSVRLNKRFIATAFFSYKDVDANADSLDVFSTLQTTGLHNTPSSMNEKDAVSEMVLGANGAWSMKKLRIGVTGLWHSFGGEYQKEVHSYNRYELSKNSNANVSADYRYYFKKIHLFGELGVSQNGGLATINGLLADVTPRMQLALLHRYYQPQYQAYYANAFADGGKTANETGFYIGANIFPHPKVKTTFYFDAYYFSWLKFKAFAPSKGFEFLFQTDYMPKQSCKMYLRFKYDTKEENVRNDLQQTRTTDDVEKITLRYNIVYSLLQGLNCETRMEGSWYKGGFAGRESGLALFQDVRYSLQRLPLGFSLRYAVFNTDSYATRIYAYEADALYAFSVPAYYGRGSRWFINLQWQPLDRLDVWLRCARTFYFDKESIGDGLAENNSNRQTDVKVQLRIKF